MKRTKKARKTRKKKKKRKTRTPPKRHRRKRKRAKKRSARRWRTKKKTPKMRRTRRKTAGRPNARRRMKAKKKTPKRAGADWNARGAGDLCKSSGGHPSGDCRATGVSDEPSERRGDCATGLHCRGRAAPQRGFGGADGDDSQPERRGGRR